MCPVFIKFSKINGQRFSSYEKVSTSKMCTRFGKITVVEKIDGCRTMKFSETREFEKYVIWGKIRLQKLSTVVEPPRSIEIFDDFSNWMNTENELVTFPIKFSETIEFELVPFFRSSFHDSQKINSLLFRLNNHSKKSFL